MTKTELIDQVRDYLDQNDWNYEYLDMRSAILTGVNLKCKLQATKLYFLFNDNGFTLYANVSMKADEATRMMAMEFITRANYGTRIGNFELDADDGEIRYKVYVSTRDAESLNMELVEEAIYIVVSMLNRYGDGLMKVLMGFADSAKDEIAAIENNL